MASAKVECLLWLFTLAMLGSSQDHEPSMLVAEVDDSCSLIQTGRAKQPTSWENDSEEDVAEKDAPDEQDESVDSSVNEVHSVQFVTSIAPENRKIYTYWEYDDDNLRPWTKLNVQSWLKHAPPGTELVLVNESNFHDLIPDAPEELFKLPYAACKSDVVRAAVLYHHGGLYLDTDFMVMKPLGTVFAKLEEGWDVVAYGDSRDGHTGKCKANSFTSNFMAARKGNVVSGTWWENIKLKLSRTCDFGEYNQEKVCCHEAFAERQPEQCHIPWGHLEWLKNPASDPDVHRWNAKPNPSPNGESGPGVDAILAAVERGNAKSKQLPPDARIFCFEGREGFAPHQNGEIFWQKWDSNARATSTDAARMDEYDVRFQCHEEDNGDLNCSKGNWGDSKAVFRNFFGRTAYHLFFSTGARQKDTPEEALSSDWLLAEFLRRSLGTSS